MMYRSTYFCATREVQNADNATAFRIWSNDKLREVMQQMTSSLSGTDLGYRRSQKMAR